MAETSTLKADNTVTLQVSTTALIAGISVVGTILLVVCVVGICIWCRNLMKRKKRDRTRQYMVHDGASPFSSLHGRSSGGNPSYNAAGYENKAVDHGELRPNPLAENPYPPGHASSMLNLPPILTDYNGEQRRYITPRIAQSTQSLSLENESFYASMYDKLVDTIHSHQGRPLYLCKREDYHSMADHFDIVGKTRMNDWLIRPRANTPDRPRRKNSKKQKAPKPSNPENHKHNIYRKESQRNNGYVPRAGDGARIATPFGAGIATRYHSGSQLGLNDGYDTRYTSLPRDGKLHQEQNHDGKRLRRQASSGEADRKPQHRLDEQQYAQVMKKNALNGGAVQSANYLDRQNPNRRPIGTIEESPQVVPQRAPKTADQRDSRERSASVSTVKSLGITDQFKFLEQYDTEEERF